MIDVRMAGVAYAVPPDIETVADILRRERGRVEAVLAPLSEASRRRAMEGLGLERMSADRAAPTIWFARRPHARWTRPSYCPAAWT
jgi:hypothetical protein